MSCLNCIHELFELHGTLASGGCEPTTLKLSPDARSIVKDYVNRTGKEQAAMQGHLARQWSKLEEIPARLAIILHCVQQVTTGVADRLGYIRMSTDEGPPVPDTELRLQ